jgi:hypothetical protein
MALTEAKIKDLEDKLFDELFTEHRPVWTQLAKKAFTHAKQNITGGRTPRPDDVAKVLYPMLEVHEDLRKHQETNRARAPRFTQWFTEYVIDKTLDFKEKQNEND